ncbi:N-formylglutamate amidohydrolase [Rhodophyticola sp.]|jgi:predicted N-formylglutamate amidohydrolase|uniref:N-formylglutamate amidohydrolase n=1 Tax=Rhodophyticola sp. TaxID=2680032 RepID=UPI003D2CB942
MSALVETEQDKVVETFNPTRSGPVVLLCEHASHHIPAQFQDLGLTEASRHSHAAWDPGAVGVALNLSELFDAPLVAGRVSRLVYDCNRPPEAVSAMPDRSEAIDIPGNRNLTPEDRLARERSIYRPFLAAVDTVLDRRRQAGTDTALVTVHSFAPVFHGRPRDVDIGIVHDADARLANAVLERAPSLSHRKIGRNDPYGPEDGVTHSLKLHGMARSLPNVMIEIRNDLIGTPAEQRRIAAELHSILAPALTEVGLQAGGPPHA